MSDMVQIAYTKSRVKVVDPNRVINAAIRDVAVSLVQADQISNSRGVMLY